MKWLTILVLVALPLSAARATIEVSVPTLTCAPGDTIDIPVHTTSIPDSTVLSCQFTLRYSASVVTVLSIVTEGTLVGTSGWSANANISADSLTVGAFGAQFMTDEGAIVILRCRIRGGTGSSTLLTLRRFTFNAGTPAVTMMNGGLNIITGLGSDVSNRAVVSSLHQNFPNPFNPSTVIPYALGSRTNVHLSIISPLGQEMRVLVDQYQDAGEYRATFDAAGLASGVYFYRLTAGQFTQTRKLTLVR